MIYPSILADAAVERATNECYFLVKTCLVVPSAHSQWNALCGDKVVDIGAMDMVQLSDGNWALACETELDEVMSANEYNAMISGDIA